MARIYRGDLEAVPQEVLDRLKSRLPDDYHVVVGVEVEGREVDLWILRSLSDYPAVNVVIENKALRSPNVRGNENGPWLIASGHELNCNSATNPHLQSVRAAEAIVNWLWKNQHCIWSLSRHLRRDGKEFGVWPSVLITSPLATSHNLPMSPTSRFGSWYFGDTAVDDLIANILEWRPKFGRPMSHENIENILERLGVEEWEQPLAA